MWLYDHVSERAERIGDFLSRPWFRLANRCRELYFASPHRQDYERWWDERHGI